MADSRNQSELETSSYRPTSAPPEVKGKNTSIIESETGVEKSEVVGQPLEQPEWAICKKCGAVWNPDHSCCPKKAIELRKAFE